MTAYCKGQGAFTVVCMDDMTDDRYLLHDEVDR